MTEDQKHLSLRLALDDLNHALEVALPPIEYPGPIPTPENAQDVANIFRLAALALHLQNERREEDCYDLMREYEDRHLNEENALLEQVHELECKIARLEAGL